MDYGREIYQALHRPPYDLGLSDAFWEYSPETEKEDREEKEECASGMS